MLIIIKQFFEWRTALYLQFVDFKKVFALRPWNIEKKRRTSLLVLHNGNIWPPFHTNAGVKQKYSISPQLFTIMLDDIMNNIYSERKEIT